MHTFVGAQATTPRKSKQRDNCPGLANQDKLDQYGMQTKRQRLKALEEENLQLPLLETLY